MGTSLTGLTPATTYDALIKVGDNGPLTSTLKRLSDGLGNDSAISLSTLAMRVDGSTTTIGSAGTPALYLTNSDGNAGTAQQYATLGTSSTPIATLFRGNGLTGTTANGLNIDNFGGFQVRVNQLGGSGDSINFLGGNVGIGTSSPAARLSVSNLGAAGIELQPEQTADTNRLLNYNRGTGNYVNFKIDSATNQIFISGIEVARFTANGLSFNGDTAAANALDDYEEGVFSPTIIGSVVAGTANYTLQQGRYTKIGRQVSVQLDVEFNSGTGSGDLQITGLPFSESQTATNPAVTIGFVNGIPLTANNYMLAYLANSTNRIDLIQYPVGGTTITSVPYSASGRVILNVTYLAN